MDSGTLGDYIEDLKSLRRRRTENYKVYTRRTKKKAHKSCNNDDTASISCSTAAAPSTSAGNPTSTVTEVSSAAVVTAEVSTAGISEEPNCRDTSSPPPPRPTTSDNLPDTTLPNRTSARDHVELDLLEATVTKDGDPPQGLQGQSPYEEVVLQCGRSPNKDADVDTVADSSGEQQQHQEEMPPLLEDKQLAQNQVHEECGNQTAEKQPLEDLPHSNNNEAQKLEKSPPVRSANEPLQVSDKRLPCENDPPIGRELAASDLLPGIELLPNDKRVATDSPQDPKGSLSASADGVTKPPVISCVNDRVRINLCNTTQKDDIKDLRKKLELELDQVRRLIEQFETKELQLASYNTQISNSNLSINGYQILPESANGGRYSQPQPQHSQIEIVERKLLVTMNSEMSVMRHQETRPTGLARINSDMGAARNLESRPYRRQLSIALMENNEQGVEKEKRTPKANQYYRNSEFLLGKDRLPPENTKRFKSNNGRKHSRGTGRMFGFGSDKSRNSMFRSCGSLLQRLMKHKYGWVFNEPVDAKALGLVDYHVIIKHPMDLGTIKTRLAQNWYKSPVEFAEDVRLVFHNAMTYNPKGQDVHVMAEQLLQIFEERWAIIETEYNPYWKYQIYQEGELRTPTYRKAPPKSHVFAATVPSVAPIPALIPATVHGPPYVPASASIPLGALAASQTRSTDEPEPKKTTMVDSKIQRPHFGRTPVPKKPKAKDLNKRDMTYDEKQRLSTHLQGLPPEKLDAILQIIKKRNTAVSQHDDEIEVDIDSVDTETLWELDRFVTNYKKSLSKNKRKAELALQARMAGNWNVALMNSTPAPVEVQIESGPATEKGTATPAEGENKGNNRSRSSSSNSSSSDSGSSSSDSGSESSSADGSDAGHSPRT